MAFNFLQFAGGFADVVVEKVKAEEAQAREDESWDRRFQKQQDAINARTRGQARRDREKAAEEMLGELLSLGYTEEEANYAVSSGKGTYNIWKKFGLDAVTKGVTGSSLLNAHDKLKQPQPRTRYKIGEEIINDAQKTLEGTNSPQIIPTTLAPFSFNPKSVAALYTPLDDTDISLDMQLSNNTQRQLKLIQDTNAPDYDNKIKALREEETFLLNQIGKLADTKRKESNTNQPVNVTEHNTLNNIIGKNHLYAIRRAGFRVDAETQFMEAFEGKEGRGFSAQLESVDLMEKTISSLGDFAVDRLAAEKVVVLKGLERHGKSEYYKSITPSVDSNGVVQKDNNGQFKMQGKPLQKFDSFTDFNNAIVAGGMIKIGEPVLVPNANGTGYIISIFTNVLNKNAFPMFEGVDPITLPVYSFTIPSLIEGGN
tara:strand:+ start:2764 stop:4044 length:1281 start_codon:yes stop_codon:yes gene_type:complete